MRTVLATLVLAGLASVSSADIIGQFNFNSVVPDAATATGSLLPNVGTGSVALLGGTTATFASGDATGGSTDPVTGDDSGYNLTAWAAQGTGSGDRGLRVNISTVGFTSVLSLTWDQRFSNTSSRFVRVDYTLDGSTFVNGLATIENTGGGDFWLNNNSVDLSGIAGAANNANFGVRFVSVFGPAGGYVTSSPTGNYATTGTWRFDMVTVNGLVPSPGAAGMLGLAALAGTRRRR